MALDELKINEKFRKELQDLLNKHSVDNELNTPDHILAGLVIVYLMSVSELVRNGVKASHG